MTESILLSLLGGGAGAILSVFGIRLLRNTLPAGMLQWFCDVSELVGLNRAVFAFTALVAVVEVPLSGLAPAWNAQA